MSKMFAKNLGLLVCTIFTTYTVCNSEDMNLCSSGEITTKQGSLHHTGSSDRCVCFISATGNVTMSHVYLELHMKIEETTKVKKGCFPRVGIKTTKNDNPYHICPDFGVTRSIMMELLGDDTALVMINNRDKEEYNAEVKFSSVPAESNLNIRCTVDNNVESWEPRYDEQEFSDESIPPENPRRTDGTGIAIGISVAIIVLAIIGVVVFLFIRKQRSSGGKGNKKSKQNGNEVVDAENPAYHPDSVPPQRSAPTYGNVNLNPNPNQRQDNGISKGSSVGNLSTASSISSVGTPDMGAGVIQSAGVGYGVPPKDPQQPQYEPQHSYQPQQPVHTQI